MGKIEFVDTFLNIVKNSLWVRSQKQAILITNSLTGGCHEKILCFCTGFDALIDLGCLRLQQQQHNAHNSAHNHKTYNRKTHNNAHNRSDYHYKHSRSQC